MVDLVKDQSLMQKLKPDLIEYIPLLNNEVKINNNDTISKLDNKIKRES